MNAFKKDQDEDKRDVDFDLTRKYTGPVLTLMCIIKTVVRHETALGVGFIRQHRNPNQKFIIVYQSLNVSIWLAFFSSQITPFRKSASNFPPTD